MDEHEQRSRAVSDLHRPSPSESSYEAGRISRRAALKRIGLTAGGIALLGLGLGMPLQRANANLNAQDDPVPLTETSSSSSSGSSYQYYYYYYGSDSSCAFCALWKYVATS